MSNNQPTISRRKLLQALVATGGAITLTNLPRQWQTPVIETGVLPIHAQGSPSGDLTISSLSFSGSQGVCDAGGRAGNVFSATFNYSDGTGGQVEAGAARVRAVYNFSNGTSDTTEVTLDAINITGNGLDGTIVVPLCVDFNGANSADVTISITNNISRQSNTRNSSLSNPA